MTADADRVDQPPGASPDPSAGDDPAQGEGPGATGPSPSSTAAELFLADGRTAGVYYCTACRFVARERDTAERCCAPRHCEDCGDIVPEKYWMVCRRCLAVRNDARDQARWDKAAKIAADDYDGMIYDEDADAFHDGFDAFLDAWSDRDDPEQTPPRLYACESYGLAFEAFGWLEHLTQEHHEDAYEQIDGRAVAQLQAVLDSWAKANGPTSYRPDYARAIVWTPPEDDDA